MYVWHRTETVSLCPWEFFFLNECNIETGLKMTMFMSVCVCVVRHTHTAELFTLKQHQTACFTFSHSVAHR